METDIPDFDMSSVRTNQSIKPESSTSRNGLRYEWESSDVYNVRKAVADKYIQAGLTFKHAWYKAFQEHPRVYLDEADKPSSPSEDDRSPGKTFFKPRV